MFLNLTVCVYLISLAYLLYNLACVSADTGCVEYGEFFFFCGKDVVIAVMVLCSCGFRAASERAWGRPSDAKPTGQGGESRRLRAARPNRDADTKLILVLLKAISICRPPNWESYTDLVNDKGFANQHVYRFSTIICGSRDNLELTINSQKKYHKAY